MVGRGVWLCSQEDPCVISVDMVSRYSPTPHRDIMALGGQSCVSSEVPPVTMTISEPERCHQGTWVGLGKSTSCLLLCFGSAAAAAPLVSRVRGAGRDRALQRVTSLAWRFTR